MKTLKCFIVFSMLLMVTGINMCSFAVIQDTGILQSCEMMHAPVPASKIKVNTAEVCGAQYFTSETIVQQAENVLLVIDEDEENEHCSFAKKGTLQTANAKPLVYSDTYAAVSFVPTALAQDEHLNNEKVYLLNLVFRI